MEDVSGEETVGQGDILMLTILGVQLVLLLGLLSLEMTAFTDWGAFGILVYIFATFVLGVGSMAARKAHDWARPTLIVAFPFFSILAHTSITGAVSSRSWTALLLSFCVLVVWALYVGVVAQHFTRIRERRQVSYRSLGGTMAPEASLLHRKEFLQHSVVMVVSGFLLIIASVLPLLSTTSSYYRAAAPASVLVAVYALGISGGVLGLFLAPAMRREKRSKRLKQRASLQRQGAVLIGVGVVAFALYCLMVD